MDNNQLLLDRDLQEYPRDKPDERIVAVRNLSKHFGNEIAVNDLTFDIPPGIIFGFVGPSGCGKTTTIRLLTGIYAPTQGEVSVMGYNPKDFPRNVREKIGYMPQLFFLYPQLTVWENLNFVASLYGMHLFQRDSLNNLLEFVELDGHEKKLVQDLSGGMRRRLTLATTLVQDPQLLFLDEPTAGIDPVLRRKFWTHFQGLKEQGKTMFVTTQYVGEVAYCDLVGVMDQGRLLMVDSPEGLRYRTFGGDIVDIQTESRLAGEFVHLVEELPFVKKVIYSQGNHLRATVNQGNEAIPDFMEWFGQQGIEIASIEEYLPPFDDVFVQLIEQKENDV